MPFVTPQQDKSVPPKEQDDDFVLDWAFWENTPLSLLPPTDIKFYDCYVSRRNEFDKKFDLLLRKRMIDKREYEIRRHYYALGVV